MLLADFRDQRGLSNDELAALLNERGVSIQGRSVDGRDVARRLRKGMPKYWAAALELDNETPPPPPPDADPSSKRPQEDAPKPPPGAKIEVPVPDAGARKRISGAYKFAGAALAAGSGSQGVAHVWGDSSDRIADLWIEAAKENPWASRFVELMSAGGTTGDLAAAHLYLAGATLYVLGAGIPGGDAIFARYSRHRVVRVTADENGSAAAHPDDDGAATEPATGHVVDPS